MIEKSYIPVGLAVQKQYRCVTDTHPDSRTDTRRQQRPRLRIASRGQKRLGQH